MDRFSTFLKIAKQILGDPFEVKFHSVDHIVKVMSPLMALTTFGTVIEIGTDSGLSAMALALSSDSNRLTVHSFDTDDSKTSRANALKQHFGVSNVFFYNGSSDSAVQIAPPYSLVFVDTTFYGCYEHMERLCPHVSQHGYMIVHDYYDFLNGRYVIMNKAPRKFLKAHPDWQAMMVPGYIILTRSPQPTS